MFYFIERLLVYFASTMKLLAVILSTIYCVAASTSVDNAARDATLLHVRIDELPERELHMYTARAVNIKRQAPSFATYGDAINFMNNLQQTQDTSDEGSLPWGTAKKCTAAPDPATCASCAIVSGFELNKRGEPHSCLNGIPQKPITTYRSE
jgi:hypothetical protein